jgi:hypothetical protein
MQRPGHQLLPRAALPEHQDRAVGIGDALDHLEHLLHLGRAADDLAELVFLLELLAQVSRLRHRRVVRKRPLHAQLELIHLEGLLQVIERPMLHRIHRRLYRAKPGNDDHHRRRRHRARLLHHLQPVRPGLVEIKVRDHQVWRMRRQPRKRRAAAGEGEYLMPFLTQQLGDHLHHGQVIIDQ